MFSKRIRSTPVVRGCSDGGQRSGTLRIHDECAFDRVGDESLVIYVCVYLASADGKFGVWTSAAEVQGVVDWSGDLYVDVCDGWNADLIWFLL
jgi:hypothetical protein